jgi:UDP-N-acetyl-D-glucosamine dehydrogenase
MSELDAVTICVPTPLSKTRTPDISHVVSAAESVAENLAPGQLVVLQSTTYPGTTEEIVLPILERSGLRAGRDFFLGYAPERVDPGNERYTIRNTPKLVAGVTDECRRRTELLYRQIVDDVIPVSSTMVAETAKLHENTFRAVNIALANELALMCSRLGISSWEVIEAASTKPFGFLPHYPGPGLGGDCIPVVPHFLAWRLREYGYSPQLIEAAHEVNAQMPVFVVHKVVDALNETGRPVNGSRVLLLGMAYKPDIHDTRESPSLEVMRQLLERHAEVRYCDPWVEEVELDGTRHVGVEWSPERVREADCVVLLTPHRRFLSEPLWGEASLIVDTRDVVPEAPNVHRL